MCCVVDFDEEFERGYEDVDSEDEDEEGEDEEDDNEGFGRGAFKWKEMM